MLVVNRFADGDCSIIHYERKRLSTYLSQQIKSITHMRDVESFNTEFNMTSDFMLAADNKISRFIKNRIKVNSYKEYHYITLPSSVLQIKYTGIVSGDTIMWKEIIVLPIKLEKKLIPLLEKAREYDLSSQKQRAKKT